MRICELHGEALDTAIIEAVGSDVTWDDDVPMPSETWQDTGRLIERYRVALAWHDATTYNGPHEGAPPDLRSDPHFNRLDRLWWATIGPDYQPAKDPRAAVCRVVLQHLALRNEPTGWARADWMVAEAPSRG